MVQQESMANIHLSYHTISEKCLLTLPLNGWKPESRILLEPALILSGECGLFLVGVKWLWLRLFMRVDGESTVSYDKGCWDGEQREGIRNRCRWYGQVVDGSEAVTASVTGVKRQARQAREDMLKNVNDAMPRHLLFISN